VVFYLVINGIIAQEIVVGWESPFLLSEKLNFILSVTLNKLFL